MPKTAKTKPKVSIPSFRLHKPSGRAVVTLNGRDHYLGDYSAPESQKQYGKLIDEWLAHGRRLPPEEPPAETPVIFTVNEMVLGYYRHCEQKYARRRRAGAILSHIRVALAAVRGLYGSTAAINFGSKALLAVRQRLIDGGWERRNEKGEVIKAEPLSRKSVNDAVGIIKRMLDWAITQEQITAQHWYTISRVKGLLRDESAAAEPVTVSSVPNEYVDAVLPHVLPPVKAMIELQRLTGMRPGEVIIMRGKDLDMTGELWLYKPEYHKTHHRGHKREVYFGQRGQDVIKPFLRANVEEYLFRPDEACRELREKERGKDWSKHHKARSEQRRQRGHRRPAKDHYSVDSYRRAIQRACIKAEVPSWHPHQLRHLAKNMLQKQFGVEAARITLGHKHISTTELYGERDAAVAKTIAQKIG